MHKVTSAIRSAIIHTPTLQDKPLELYTMARQCGWEEGAKLASNATLRLNLASPHLFDVLKKMDTESFMKLQNLHRSRREGLNKGIQRKLGDVWSSRYQCTCREARAWSYQASFWTILAYKLSGEMERRPLGDVLRNDPYYRATSFVSDLWYSDRCYHFNPFPDRDHLKEGVIQILDSLPTTI